MKATEAPPEVMEALTDGLVQSLGCNLDVYCDTYLCETCWEIMVYPAPCKGITSIALDVPLLMAVFDTPPKLHYCCDMVEIHSLILFGTLTFVGTIKNVRCNVYILHQKPPTTRSPGISCHPRRFVKQYMLPTYRQCGEDNQSNT
jgi:hypothetical protein